MSASTISKGIHGKLCLVAFNQNPSASDSTFDYWRYRNISLTLTLTLTLKLAERGSGYIRTHDFGRYFYTKITPKTKLCSADC